MSKLLLKTSVALLAVSFLSACTGVGYDTGNNIKNQIEGSPDFYATALSNAKRSEADIALDERRKPAEIMQFFEIKPGMEVLDVFAGGGYYTELMSYVVGPTGSVMLYNNDSWNKFVGKAVTDRLKENRLPNVETLVTSPETLADSGKKYDAAIFVLGMHDIYYADTENGWLAIDKAKFMKNIYDSLEKGAVFGVIDANAEPGADNGKVGKDIHRVDPEAIIADVVAAGFKLEAQSDVLRNPDDDRTTSVFLPENRYNTDRSVLKFRK